MKGLKPFEDTIYIDSVPVIEFNERVFVQFKEVEQKEIYLSVVNNRMVFSALVNIFLFLK